MIAILFRESQALPDLADYRGLYASKIIHTECLRTCHRMRIREKYPDERFAGLLSELQELLRDLDLVPVTDGILEDAGDAFPTVIGTLDGIHLSTALNLKKRNGINPVLLTHDRQLQIAAQALGFGVRG